MKEEIEEFLSIKCGSTRESIYQAKNNHLLFYSSVINRCFGENSIAEIISKLIDEKNENIARNNHHIVNWIDSILSILIHRQCPTSLCVTLEMLKKNRVQSPYIYSNAFFTRPMIDCIADEYLIALRMRRNDLQEGINSLLVRRDGKAKWNPAHFQEVKDEFVRSCFLPLPLSFSPISKNIIPFYLLTPPIDGLVVNR